MGKRSKKDHAKKSEVEAKGSLAKQNEASASLSKKDYERELYKLQVELVKLQEWVKKTGAKIIVIFEGRDAAGKGGVTAKFNLNLLVRVNRELGGTFKLDTFEHHAFYNRERHRIEMHLASLKRQKV